MNSTPAGGSTPEAAPPSAAQDRPRITPILLDPATGAAAATPSGAVGFAPGGVHGTILGEMIGGLLGRVTRILSASFTERSLQAAREVGQWAVLAGAGLTLVYAIFAAIKYNSFGVFLAGLIMTVALGVAQYAAMRFLHASAATITSTPSRISSMAFLDCTGLLAVLGAVAVLVGGIVSAIQLSSVLTLLPAVLLAAALMFFGAVALHPALVNVATADGTAGEDAIGLLAFFAKAGLKLVPLFFGLLAVGGCIAIVASFFAAGQQLASAISSSLPLPRSSATGIAGAAVVLCACLLPLLTYFIFLLQYLVLDVFRSILSLPAKVDGLRHAP